MHHTPYDVCRIFLGKARVDSSRRMGIEDSRGSAAGSTGQDSDTGGKGRRFRTLLPRCDAPDGGGTRGVDVDVDVPKCVSCELPVFPHQ